MSGLSPARVRLLAQPQPFDKMCKASRELASLLHALPERLVDANADRLRVLKHDLRTPVGQIVGYCELLGEECEERGYEAFLPAIANVLVDAKLLRQAVDALGAELASRMPSMRARSGPIEAASAGTILVVDDNEANRELLSRLLRRDGFRVHTASNGHDGLALARSGEVDLVLLDIVMPDMDGYEMLAQLGAEVQRLPVIMLTSLDERESITRCIEAGAWDHVPKPFDPVILRARLSSALERKAARDKERRYLAQIVAEKQRADDLLHGVIPIGVALTRERDEARLLARILDEARRFCGAEGGAIWLCKHQHLQMMRIQVDALGLAGPPDPPVELGVGEDSAQSPAVQAVMSGKPINIRDVGQAGDFDVSHVRAFDQRHGFRTRSLLSLPLRLDDEPLGVLELWNATRASGDEVTGFDPATIEVLASLSLLAAVALDAERREHDLRQRIRTLEIRVDAGRRERQVSEITETEYFQRLRERARELRKGTRG